MADDNRARLDILHQALYDAHIIYNKSNYPNLKIDDYKTLKNIYDNIKTSVEISIQNNYPSVNINNISPAIIFRVFLEGKHGIELNNNEFYNIIKNISSSNSKAIFDPNDDEDKDLWLKMLSWSLGKWKRIKEKRENKLVSEKVLYKVIEKAFYFEKIFLRYEGKINKADSDKLFRLIMSRSVGEIDEYINQSKWEDNEPEVIYLYRTYKYQQDFEKEINYQDSSSDNNEKELENLSKKVSELGPKQ